MTHGDGFGIGWYGEPAEPGVYREVMPAWSGATDSELLFLQALAKVRRGAGAVDAMQEVLHDTMTLMRGRGTVIASEPLDDEALGWEPLPAGAVVTI